MRYLTPQRMARVVWTDPVTGTAYDIRFPERVEPDHPAFLAQPERFMWVEDEPSEAEVVEPSVAKTLDEEAPEVRRIFRPDLG